MSSSRPSEAVCVVPLVWKVHAIGVVGESVWGPRLITFGGRRGDCLGHCGVGVSLSTDWLFLVQLRAKNLRPRRRSAVRQGRRSSLPHHSALPAACLSDPAVDSTLDPAILESLGSRWRWGHDLHLYMVHGRICSMCSQPCVNVHASLCGILALPRPAANPLSTNPPPLFRSELVNVPVDGRGSSAWREGFVRGGGAERGRCGSRAEANYGDMI
jgi:hypothetical protein